MFLRLMLCVFVALMLAGVALADVPQTMNFQGVLLDNASQPISSTTAVVFAIWNDESYGDSIWSELRTIEPDNQGRFSIVLGVFTPLTEDLFEYHDRWLSIAVVGDPEMTPRINFTTVAYAYRSATIDGTTGGTITGDVLILGRATIGTGNTNSGAGAAVSGGQANYASADFTTIAGGFLNGTSAGFATISGGTNNVASGEKSTISGGIANHATEYGTFIGGGATNYATGNLAAIDGGSDNTADGEYSFIGGGKYGEAYGNYSVVGGGDHSDAQGANSSVVGGFYNHCQGDVTFIGGGGQNTCIDMYSTIAGGGSNSTTGNWSTVAGGLADTTNGDFAFIGGGWKNRADSMSSLVCGGRENISLGYHSAIVGGSDNQITMGDPLDPTFAAFIGGGGGNRANRKLSVIGGGSQNSVSGAGSSIVGGHSNYTGANYAFVGGGWIDSAYGSCSVVAGGQANSAYEYGAFIGGGNNNTAAGSGAVVPGGSYNGAYANYSTVCGGYNNAADGFYSSIPGGRLNHAQGDYSLAAGYRAQADNSGIFAWADDNDFNFPAATEPNFTPVANMFMARSTGGAIFVSGVDGSGNSTAGVQLPAGGGSWSSLSDRNLKESFQPVDCEDILAKIGKLYISTWKYKAQEDSIRHIGPMAQDVYAAFGVGEDERHITSIDADGIALAAIQGLYQQNQEQQKRIEGLEALVNKLLEDKD